MSSQCNFNCVVRVSLFKMCIKTRSQNTKIENMYTKYLYLPHVYLLVLM